MIKTAPLYWKWKYYKMKDGLYRGGKPRRFIHYAIYGKEVPSDFVLVFKDGNKENITIENLQLLRKKDMIKTFVGEQNG